MNLHENDELWIKLAIELARLARLFLQFRFAKKTTDRQPVAAAEQREARGVRGA